MTAKNYKTLQRITDKVVLFALRSVRENTISLNCMHEYVPFDLIVERHVIRVCSKLSKKLMYNEIANEGSTYSMKWYVDSELYCFR